MDQEINYFEQLMRIADTIIDEDDRNILRSAASKLIPQPTPRIQHTKYIQGFGYMTTRLY